MAFVPITDLKEADKLWEAGLLWFKWGYSDTYEFDESYTQSDDYARERARPTYADYVDYFILVEE